MKIIVVGATGYVAAEVLRQALCIPSITSVVALARREVSLPENLGANSDSSKLTSIVLDDFGEYSHQVKKQLESADACIWTLAITPSKSRGLEWDHVKRVCHDYTLIGLKAILEARKQSDKAKPLRFMYMSGVAAERDQTKPPTFMPQYSLMRGEVENQVLAFAAEHKGEIEVCVAKPGLIKDLGFSVKGVIATTMQALGVVPTITVHQVSAAMLDQVINGFEKEPLMNYDLVRLGQKALESTSS